MSGSGGGRSDGYVGGGGTGGGSSGGGGLGPGGGGPVDPCSLSYKGPINSPKAAALANAKIGDQLTVSVDKSGRSPVLVVKTLAGDEAGSLTFNGYLNIIKCIESGAGYIATITNIAGGVYQVTVDPR